MSAPRLRLLVLALILGLLVACAAQAGYYDVVMDDSPVAYWRLNETSGTTVYDSAGSHNGTLSGAYTPGVPGALSNYPGDPAMNFSGGTVVVPYSGEFDGNSFSVEAWARELIGPGAWRSPLMFRWNETYVPGQPTRCYGYNFYADMSNDNWEFWLGREPSGWTVVNGPDVDRGVWAHLVGTYDGTTVRFYVNGEPVGSTAVQHVVHENPSVALYIAGGPRFYGDIDEVAIYGYALSSEQVELHHAIGTPEPASLTLLVGGLALLRVRRRRR